MKIQYSDATTKRYLAWLKDRIDGGEHTPPSLSEIERWLRVGEDYRRPLDALSSLCVGLRESGCPAQIQWIACELISELADERHFASKVEDFVSAVIRRTGVDDSEVNVYAKHTRIGTLHDVLKDRESVSPKE